jgi:retron-type reverse transcriptase
VYIPKPGKKELRPLGIPSTEDKLVQLAVKKILENLFEGEFLDARTGFAQDVVVILQSSLWTNA